MNKTRYYYSNSENLELIVTKGRAGNYPWHLHLKHWTIGLISSGAVLLSTLAGKRNFYAGQHFLIAPYEPHSLRIEKGSSLSVWCVRDIETLAKPGGIFLELGLREPLLSLEEKVILERVVRNCRAKIIPAPGPPKAPNWDDSILGQSIQTIMSRIMEEPERLLPLSQMAAQAGYSRWHFLRGFQRLVGLTPHAFQMLCRLRLLRAGLRTDAAAAELAASVGFADQSHMHKAFARYHNLTPRQFRQASIKLAR